VLGAQFREPLFYRVGVVYDHSPNSLSLYRDI
jgi:hypothetical protein